jgi:hypothetical protein
MNYGNWFVFLITLQQVCAGCFFGPTHAQGIFWFGVAIANIAWLTQNGFFSIGAS